MNKYAFVSVTVVDGQAVVKVSLSISVGGKKIEDTSSCFALTKMGCVDAGRHLHSLGVETWMNSSSVDFPRDIKKSFRHDVRKLMTQGFEAGEKSDKEIVEKSDKEIVERAKGFLRIRHKFDV